jgi:hypothetical protein
VLTTALLAERDLALGCVKPRAVDEARTLGSAASCETHVAEAGGAPRVVTSVAIRQSPEATMIPEA